MRLNPITDPNQHYRLLIVDADDQERKELTACVDWPSLGFRCLQPCRDGNEALESLKLQRPDAVITELCLPHRDGLDLIRRLRTRAPEVLAVIVSSDPTGEILRESLLLGVFDFLLKPVTPGQIALLAGRIRERLDDGGGTVAFSTAREKVVDGLIRGSPDAEQRLEGVLGAVRKPRAWKAAFLEVVPQSQSGDGLLLPVGRLLETMPVLAQKQWNLTRQSHELTLLFHGHSPAQVDPLARDACGALVQALHSGGHWVVCGLGSAVGGASEVPLSCQQSRLAAEKALFRGPGTYPFVPEELGAGRPREPALYPERFVQTLYSGGNWDALVEEYWGAISRSATAVRRLQQEIQALFSALADLVPSSSELDRYYHFADFARGPDDVKSLLRSLCRQAVEAIVERGSSLAERKVREFRECISRHYMEWDLTVAAVSSHLQISSSYLGKILKKKLSTTFVNYLADVRMAKAQELLSGSDLTTSRISELVGYAYTNYFSSTFKKRTGFTPSEFRSWFRTRVFA
jgi:two-component system, response regulator YesN